MGEIFKHFIDLIKDKTTSWGFKTAFFISVIGLIIVSDFYLGFSYNYHLNNKIEQLDKISNIKENYTTDPIILNGLSEMERKVFYKKHYSDELSRLFLKDTIKSEISEIIDQNNPANNKPKTTTKKPIRSVYWMMFTSNYLIIAILPFIVFLPLYSKDGRKSKSIVGWFASLVFIFVFILITTSIAYIIPVIYNNPLWNYIINFTLHTAFWVMILKLGND